jgi:hypothetical protein
MTAGYTPGMKIAISVPDDLSARAEEFASRLGITRSRLHADALRSYIEWREDQAIRHALDRVHADSPEPLDDGFKRAQAKVLRESEW